MNRPFDRIPRWLRLTSLQWAIVIGAAVLAALVGVLLQGQREQTYSATAKVLFRNAGLDSTLFGSTVFSSGAQPDRDASTNVKLILSNTVADRVAEVSGLPESAADDILAKISVGSDGNSDIALITASDPDPDLAANFANAWAEQFRQSRIAADRAKVQEALDAATRRVQELRTAGASEAELDRQREDLARLSLLSSVQLGNVEIADRAKPPTDPDQSSSKQIAVGVGLLQGILGLGLMATYRRLRDPVDDAEDLEPLRLPVLAELPRGRRLIIAKGAPSAENVDSGLRLLLRNLRIQKGEGTTVVSVQSTRPGEGKSTVSFGLGRIAALSGLKVCLVDADLRFRTLTRGLGDPNRDGLTTILSSADGTTPSEISALIDESLLDVDQLTLLGAGPAHRAPGELSVRESVQGVVDSLRDFRNFDLVIIDAPPFLGLPDAAGFLKASDAVVIVVRRRVARLYQVRRLVDRLTVLGATPVGTVLNMATPRDEDLTYGYGPPPSADRPAAEPATPDAPSGRAKTSRSRAGTNAKGGRGSSSGG